jgi:hypothetical protein
MFTICISRSFRCMTGYILNCIQTKQRLLAQYSPNLLKYSFKFGKASVIFQFRFTLGFWLVLQVLKWLKVNLTSLVSFESDNKLGHFMNQSHLFMCKMIYQSTSTKLVGLAKTCQNSPNLPKSHLCEN